MKLYLQFYGSCRLLAKSNQNIPEITQSDVERMKKDLSLSVSGAVMKSMSILGYTSHRKVMDWQCMTS